MCLIVSCLGDDMLLSCLSCYPVVPVAARLVCFDPGRECSDSAKPKSTPMTFQLRVLHISVLSGTIISTSEHTYNQSIPRASLLRAFRFCEVIGHKV